MSGTGKGRLKQRGARIWNTAWRAALALLVGFGGGSLFAYLHLPLPWTLGSLTAAALLAVIGVKWTVPPLFRNVARPTIGVLAGSAFTLPVVLSMVHWWPVIPFLIVFYILTTLLGRFYFSRICKFDDTTATFASTPGGLGELTLLGQQLGGNVRALVVVHATRVVITVLALPFIVRLLAHLDAGSMQMPAGGAPLAAQDWLLLVSCAAIGFAIGRPFKRMGGVMLGPLILSAIVHGSDLTHSAPPAWIVILMQLIIGSLTGSRFAGISAREFRTTVLQGLVWAIVSILSAFAAAFVAVNFLDVSMAALVLAFSPGGFAEMTIIGYAAGVEVAFVVACHVFRAVSVLILAPTLLQLLPKSKPGAPPSE